MHIRPMTSADLPLGMYLKEQAGWNQTEADWRRMLDLAGDGALVAEWQNRPVGTAMSVSFGPVAWLAMVLVNPEYRNRGIGRRLAEAALEDAEARGATTIRLDATPLGQPVYERLGFTAQFELARWAGTPIQPNHDDDGPSVRRLVDEDMEQLLALDLAVTRTDRSELVRRLTKDNPTAGRTIVVNGAMTAFATWRPGSRARQIGPCLGEQDVGVRLVREVLAESTGQPVFVDVPRGHVAIERLLESAGLTVQRTLSRMVRGIPVLEDLSMLCLSSGPELG